MKRTSPQPSLLTLVVAFAVLNSACGGPSAGPSPTSPPSDVTRSGDGVRLGSGWWTVEHYANLTFRWVTNDAEVTACPNTNNRTLALMIEPGPGVRSKPFTLQVLGNHGDRIAGTVKPGRPVKVAVSQNASAETFKLHALGPNVPTPHDPRHVLNFRATSITLGSSAADCKNEVVFDGSPLELGRNWYPYETFNGQSFRWVNNNAEVKLTGAQPRPFVLEAEVEPGPGLGGLPLSILIRDASGNVIARSSAAKGRTYVDFRLPAASKNSILTLYVQSRNARAPHERRILNFRVFGLKIKP